MTRASLGRRLYMTVVVAVLKLYFALYHRLRVEGTANIPSPGPLLVILNHVSFLEVFAAGAVLFGRGYVPGANIWVISKKELFTIPVVGGFLRTGGMFPVDRLHFDRAAMRKMLDVLKAGDAIAIAPEGTRSPTGRLQPFLPALAKIAISRRVPILPIGAEGSYEALPVGAWIPKPHRITLRVGPVFQLSEFYNRNLSDADLEAAAASMRQHVAELLPEWMRVPPPPELVRQPGR